MILHCDLKLDVQVVYLSEKTLALLQNCLPNEVGKSLVVGG